MKSCHKRLITNRRCFHSRITDKDVVLNVRNFVYASVTRRVSAPWIRIAEEVAARINNWKAL